MKSKVIRLSSAVVLTGLLSLSLVACGSRKEASKTTSSKLSSSVVAKSSSSKKATKDSSVAQGSASQAVTEASGATTSDQAATPANDQANQTGSEQGQQAAETPVPSELVGTWTGTSQQATDVVMTVDAAGNVSTTANYNVDYEPYRASSTTARAVKVGENLYAWEGGDFSTLLPGITGLGGVGQAQPGFILENGQYTPVLFTAGIGQELDYSNYNSFPFSLSKS